MIKNWNDITKGEVLYLLIPFYENKHLITYDYQQTKVINIKYTPDNLGITIKFKYTDIDGYRKRLFMFINKNRYNVYTLSVNKYSFGMKPYKFGDILVSPNLDELKNVYKNLIENKQKELENFIKTQKQVLSKLDELKNNI